MAINKCPCELAIPELKLNGVNKWLALIELSSLKIKESPNNSDQKENCTKNI